jgi:small-conductance mechanosensitive channel
LESGAVEEQLSQLITNLDSAMRTVEDESENEKFIQKLKGAFVALAGGMVVTSNGLIGAGLTPVTGGISIAGAALSLAVGQDLVTRGIGMALGKD